MSASQRVIKYLGIGLAIFLIINIFYFILFSINSLFKIFDLGKSGVMNENKILPVDNFDIEEFEIELKATKLIIKTGKILKIETNNDYIKIKQEDKKIEIEEKKRSFFINDDNLELVIYLPSNLIFSKFSLEAGAGSIEIESLKTNNLEFDLGLGKTTINNLEVYKETSLNGGAGSINIKNGNIRNLDLDLGVGKLTLTSSLSGISKIESGIGDVDLNLLNEKENYQIKLSKGIGNINIDGEKYSDNEVIGNGDNIIDINGGIGNIDINFS